MTPPAPSLTSRRADAARNRAKILAASRAAFNDVDIDISMAEIARRAGVGMATLYRNFPGRQELLEALYIDEVDALCEAAVTTQAETPGAGLVAWLRRFLTFVEAKQPIAAELLKQTGSSASVMSESRARVLAAGQPLFTAAQDTHEVRDDLTLEQTLDMIVAIISIGAETEYLEPILQTALDGLRPSKQSEAR